MRVAKRHQNHLEPHGVLRVDKAYSEFGLCNRGTHHRNDAADSQQDSVDSGAACVVTTVQGAARHGARTGARMVRGVGLHTKLHVSRRVNKAIRGICCCILQQAICGSHDASGGARLLG